MSAVEVHRGNQPKGISADVENDDISTARNPHEVSGRERHPKFGQLGPATRPHRVEPPLQSRLRPRMTAHPLANRGRFNDSHSQFFLTLDFLSRKKFASRQLQFLHFLDSRNRRAAESAVQIAKVVLKILQGFSLGPAVGILVQVSELHAVVSLPIGELGGHCSSLSQNSPDVC